MSRSAMSAVVCSKRLRKLWWLMTNCIRRTSTRAGWLAAAAFLSTLFSPAQEASDNSPATPIRGFSRVYVVNFDQITPDPNFSDLAEFATSLIRLQLQEVPALDPVSTSKAPPCGAKANRPAQRTSNPAAQMPIQAQVPAQYENQQPSVIPPVLGEFFIIRGSVEIHPPNIAVDYSLEKCDGAKVTKLVADRSNFDPGKALEQLNIVSQFLLYAVQDELPQTTIAVMPFTTSAKKTEIAESVTGYLKQEVTERHGFRRSEDSGRANADYTIEGNISVVKDAVRATIFIRS